MKKIVALILSMLFVFSCAGCSKNDEDKTKGNNSSAAQTNEESAVESALTAYFDYLTGGFSDYDVFVAGAKKYLDPDGQIINGLESNKNFISSSSAAFTRLGISKENAEKIAIHTLSEIEKSASYEIEEITVDGDKATVKAKQTIADNTKVGASISSLNSNITSLNGILDVITSAAKDTNNHTTNSATITLTKIDGDWLVSNIG